MRAGSSQVLPRLWTGAQGAVDTRKGSDKAQIKEEVETYCRLILIREFNKLCGQETCFKIDSLQLEREKEN